MLLQIFIFKSDSLNVNQMLSIPYTTAHSDGEGFFGPISRV